MLSQKQKTPGASSTTTANTSPNISSNNSNESLPNNGLVPSTIAMALLDRRRVLLDVLSETLVSREKRKKRQKIDSVQEQQQQPQQKNDAAACNGGDIGDEGGMKMEEGEVHGKNNNGGLDSFGDKEHRPQSPASSSQEQKQKQMLPKHTKTIAIDFDGTVVEDAPGGDRRALAVRVAQHRRFGVLRW